MNRIANNEATKTMITISIETIVANGFPESSFYQGNYFPYKNEYFTVLPVKRFQSWPCGIKSYKENEFQILEKGFDNDGDFQELITLIVLSWKDYFWS